MTAAPDSIFTVVSRPGAVELRVLDALAPAVQQHRRLAGSVSFRTLEGGALDRQPLVFLHGRGHAASLWAPILAATVARHQVLAVDLPGFGHSGSPPFDGTDPEAGLAFFSRPVEALLRPTTEGRRPEGGENGRPPILIGHSLGALVALDIALEGRLPIAGLVLIGAMGLGPIVSNTSRLYLRTGPERLARIRHVVRWLASSHRSGADSLGSDPLGPRSLQLLREELLTVRGGRPDASRAFDSMLPLVGAPFHVAERLGEISAPTLLLWGDHDEAFPVPVAIDARTRMKRAELRVIPGGHSPHLEDPGRVAREIEAWLATLDG